MWSINNFKIFVLLFLANVNYIISIPLHRPGLLLYHHGPRPQLPLPIPGPQLPTYRPGFPSLSLIPDFGLRDIFPGFGLDHILPGLGGCLPGILPSFSKPPKPEFPPVSSEEDEYEEGRPPFQPTVVFNNALKNETCLRTIDLERGNDYKIIKSEVVSHLIENNHTDLTYLQFILQWNESKENERICTEFVGFSANMTQQCTIVECEWDDEENTTIKPAVKPSGRYLMISKMSKQIVEQISKFVKF